jgi:hypothetical protein
VFVSQHCVRTSIVGRPAKQGFAQACLRDRSRNVRSGTRCSSSRPNRALGPCEGLRSFSERVEHYSVVGPCRQTGLRPCVGSWSLSGRLRAERERVRPGDQTGLRPGVRLGNPRDRLGCTCDRLGLHVRPARAAPAGRSSHRRSGRRMRRVRDFDNARTRRCGLASHRGRLRTPWPHHGLGCRSTTASVCCPRWSGWRRRGSRSLLGRLKPVGVPELQRCDPLPRQPWGWASPGASSLFGLCL